MPCRASSSFSQSIGHRYSVHEHYDKGRCGLPQTSAMMIDPVTLLETSTKEVLNLQLWSS